MNPSSAGKPPGLTFPAPFDALWSYRARPSTDLNTIKATRAAIVWRSNHGWKVAIQAGRFLGWISRFPRDLVRFLARRGPDARRRLGRSYPGQIADMVRVAVVNGVMPRDYYAADLARHGGQAELFRYVPSHLYQTVARFLARERSRDDVALTTDKLAFECRCGDLGLPVVRTMAIAQPKGLWGPAGETQFATFPQQDLIAKPVVGRQGLGVERWRYVGIERFANEHGQQKSAQGLESYLCGRSQEIGNGILLQECLANHRDLEPFVGSALSTVRVVTVVNERDEPEIVEAFFRTSVAADAVVDNFHGGGVLFPIDIRTGRLTPGCREDYDSTEPFVAHPQTGVTIAGRLLPGWAATSVLALQAHGLFPGLALVGWDIANTPDGPVLVEANVPPGTTMQRQGITETFVGSRFLELLAFHARAWLAIHEPSGSRWRSAAQD